MARIRYRGVDVVLEGGDWSCPDADVLAYVKAIAGQHPSPPGDWHPDPDGALARWVAEKIGGELVPEEAPPPESVPGRVY
jgi:hypothetical protein